MCLDFRFRTRVNVTVRGRDPMRYTKTEKYDKRFVDQNMMGPNSMIMLEELTKDISFWDGMRILDLGCGRGLTSVFLAKEYGVNVFAYDLWISATDNYQRFKQMGVEDKVIPIHGDAHDFPFADGYFDGIVSIDAYHYFGSNDRYFAERLKPILKPGALVCLAFPGMKQEVHADIPEKMKHFWDEESLSTWHSMEWWKPKFEQVLKDLTIWEMDCFEKAWSQWMATDNPFAISDRDMMKADNGEYMNLIGITGKVR